MLPSPSGSELHDHTHAITISEVSLVGEARRFALALAARTELDETRRGRIGIVVNELGNNLVRYAPGGQLLFRRLRTPLSEGIEILAVDQGVGLDVDTVMRDGYTTGGTPGTGLGAIRRLSDEFDIYSRPSRGTIVLSRFFVSKVGSLKRPAFVVAGINLPIKNEIVCGDDWSVWQDGPDLELIVVDGLGHGPLAKAAAVEAVDGFLALPFEALTVRLNKIHQRLKSTRGGAVFLIQSKDGEVHFTGVGNVRAVLQAAHSSKTLISQNGTAGLQIGTPRVLTQKWEHHEALVLHSDGITGRWDLSGWPGILEHHPAILAAAIMRDFRRGTDDATVVVVRRSHG